MIETVDAGEMLELGHRTSGAWFSPDKQYRYALWRQWGLDSDSQAMFLMLNPSTADEFKNDPTVERCQRRAAAMGYHRLVVCNIFAFRATDPREMKAVMDPVGPLNDRVILQTAERSSLIVAAWGTHGAHMERGAAVKRLLEFEGHGSKLVHLGLSKDGHPKHPLYIGYGVQPQPWRE